MPSKHKSQQMAKRGAQSGRLPRNWPKDIPYLTDQTYSDAVTDDQRADLSRVTTECAFYAKVPPDALVSPCPWAEITTITNEKHPAYGQRGLFAIQHLEADSLVCLYLGYVHTNDPSDTDPHSDYDLALDRENGLSVDAAACGNEARFANDYRSIAERANAEFRDCLIQVKSEKRADGVKWERRVGIFVLSAGKAGKRKAGIKPGEEILVSYGKSYWEGRDMMEGFREGFEMLSIANKVSKAGAK